MPDIKVIIMYEKDIPRDIPESVATYARLLVRRRRRPLFVQIADKVETDTKEYNNKNRELIGLSFIKIDDDDGSRFPLITLDRALPDAFPHEYGHVLEYEHLPHVSLSDDHVGSQEVARLTEMDLPKIRRMKLEVLKLGGPSKQIDLSVPYNETALGILTRTIDGLAQDISNSPLDNERQNYIGARYVYIASAGECFGDMGT